MKLNKSKLTLCGGIFFVIALFYYRYQILPPEVEKHAKFTIGRVTEWHIKKGGAYNVYFTFEVNGKKYDNYINAEESKVKKLNIGDKFLVIFLKPDSFLGSPGIMLDTPVPDGVRVAPVEGWTEKPAWAK